MLFHSSYKRTSPYIYVMHPAWSLTPAPASFLPGKHFSSSLLWRTHSECNSEDFRTLTLSIFFFFDRAIWTMDMPFAKQAWVASCLVKQSICEVNSKFASGVQFSEGTWNLVRERQQRDLFRPPFRRTIAHVSKVYAYISFFSFLDHSK